MTSLLRTYSQGIRSLGSIFSQPRYTMLGALLYPVVIWLFVYVTNLNAFIYILGSENMAMGEKLFFVVASILNVFIHITDPLALSIALFAAAATVNLVALIYILRKKVQAKPKGGSAMAVGLVGAHCIACGGSLLAPIVTAIAGSGAYISAARADTAIAIALSVNILAFVLITHATLRLTSKIYKQKQE